MPSVFGNPSSFSYRATWSSPASATAPSPPSIFARPRPSSAPSTASRSRSGGSKSPATAPPCGWAPRCATCGCSVRTKTFCSRARWTGASCSGIAARRGVRYGPSWGTVTVTPCSRWRSTRASGSSCQVSGGAVASSRFADSTTDLGDCLGSLRQLQRRGMPCCDRGACDKEVVTLVEGCALSSCLGMRPVRLPDVVPRIYSSASICVLRITPEGRGGGQHYSRQDRNASWT